MVAALTFVCRFCLHSSVLTVANFSVSFLVHLLFKVYFRLFMWLPHLNVTTPTTTRCLDYTPSVKNLIVFESKLFLLANLSFLRGDGNI